MYHLPGVENECTVQALLGLWSESNGFTDVAEMAAEMNGVARRLASLSFQSSRVKIA
jgi:hypothetical protein